MEKTEWFPASIMPVREGLYEVERPCMSGTEWAHCKMLWTDKRWKYPADHLYSEFGSPFENGNKWRGLKGSLVNLTDWIPCKTPPVRDGWYDVQRNFNSSWPTEIERVRFQDGRWDLLLCKSELAIWSGYDYWRGVTEESKGGE